MNKKLFLLGVVTIGLLLLGSLPAVAQDGSDLGFDPFGELFDGAVDLSYDLSLTHVGSPQSITPNGFTNTNLRYNLTSMKSPLDQFFNVGAFMFGDGETGPMPEFMVNGTFEGSELFVKIVNDQYSATNPNNRLLDWQATLTLKNDIDFEVLIPSTADLGGFPIDLMPTSVTIPGGSGIPPLPVIQSTTSFSYFNDLNDLAHSYGYDGLPFVSPAIFYVENISAADEYWTTVDLNTMFPPTEGITIDLTTHLDVAGFALNIEAAFFNTTADFGNVSVSAHWNTAGWLDHFEAVLFADLDQSTSLDPEEEFSVMFNLLDTTPSQADLPIRVGDQGEYIINMDFSATLAMENATEQELAQSMIDEISASINELDGEKLLNYTVDAMDGLYYHIDGYLLDLPRFMQDRLGFLGGEGAQTPLPIEDYYMSIAGMDQGKDDFALNLFDAGVYRNTTMFYEIYDGYHYVADMYQDPTTGEWIEIWDYQPLQAIDENTTQIDKHMPGIVNAMIYEKSGWNWDLSIQENMAALTDVYNGPVDYVEVEDTWYDGYEWHYDTYEVVQIISNDTFTPYVNYVAVLEIEKLPESGFTSYQTMTSPYMMMFGDNGDSEPSMDVGFAAEDPYVEPSQDSNSVMNNILPNLQSMLPLPARTPDWDQIGGPIVFLEGYVLQVADVITDPDFIALLEEMAVQDPGDLLDIEYFDMDMDWMVNGTHASAESWVDLDMTMVDNDTGNMKIVSQSATVDSYECYLWFNTGIFDSAMVSAQMHVDASSEDWPSDETTTTTIPLQENDTTTTETALELTPGFEVVFTLGSLIALPLFFKKRR